MLVIRRRPGETLVIGDDIEIEILEAAPTQVKLGIRAPRSVTVLRKEIQLTCWQNRAAARQSSPAAMDAAARRLRQAFASKALLPDR
ncbi:MAG TPA: carbon storage regulator [Bryobacteraceae bacterium]|nr:carbon storage regulator [Bryobacteraceae bacterium]